MTPKHKVIAAVIANFPFNLISSSPTKDTVLQNLSGSLGKFDWLWAGISSSIIVIYHLGAVVGSQ